LRSTPYRTAPIALIVTAVLMAIAVVGCSASSQATVPNVTGMDEATAMATLSKVGLVGEAAQTPNATAATGTVISQEPIAGAGAPAGTKVAISVSSGLPSTEDPGQSDGGTSGGGTSGGSTSGGSTSGGSGTTTVRVPRVTGLGVGAARTRIHEAGLKYHTVNASSKTVPRLDVISQSPQAGTTLAKSAVVTIKVSTGQPYITIPSVAGNTQAMATAKLKNAGFRVEVVHHDSDTVHKGLVITQTPPGGSKHSPGIIVHIAVSLGPTPIPNVRVPNVVGKDVSVASKVLKDLGFKVVVRDEASLTPVGKILSQNPVAGTSLDKGSKVIITESTGPVPEPDQPLPQ
jgi:beta-lactam-binding protein with PASTA domain